MGGGASKSKDSKDAVALIKQDTTDKRWVEEKTFEAENSLVYASSPLFNELRGILAEPLGQRFLGEFAKSENSQENFFAWIDMEEYKQIPTRDYRRCIAKNIYQKYIKDGAVMQLGSMTQDRIAYYEKSIYGGDNEASSNHVETLNTVRKSNTRGRLDLSTDLFQGLQHMVFREMAENTFKRFKSSEMYQEYMSQKNKTYNTVDVGDFDYLSYIGQGAFGMVAHVRKKSTNAEYAMKVMSKSKLVKTMGRRGSFERRKEKINIERDALANSPFPFIVEMHYAFQTERDTIIVMEYVRGGTLHSLMQSYPDHKMPEEHVRFIAAELAMALRHLHSCNYVHRDLKPINVLMSADGHVKLADMGLVSRIDETKKIKKMKSEAVLKINPDEADEEDEEDEEEDDEEEEEKVKTPKEIEQLAKTEEEEKKVTEDGDLQQKLKEEQEKRRTTVSSPSQLANIKSIGRRYTKVGTMGYKAPELLLAKRPRRRTEEERARGEAPKQGRGYCESVDWWSLGVLLLEMFCGKNHYAPKATQLIATSNPEKLELSVIEALELPSSKIPSGCSPEGKDFVDGLLEKDPHQRLGTSPLGYAGIRKHPWFHELNLFKLLNREIDPPYTLPNVTKAETHSRPKWDNFDLMKREVDSVDINSLMGETQEDTLEDRHQKYFDRWDYIAPQTFRLELMSQRNREGGALRDSIVVQP